MKTQSFPDLVHTPISFLQDRNVPEPHDDVPKTLEMPGHFSVTGPISRDVTDPVLWIGGAQGLLAQSDPVPSVPERAVAEDNHVRLHQEVGTPKKPGIAHEIETRSS